MAAAQRKLRAPPLLLAALWLTLRLPTASCQPQRAEDSAWLKAFSQDGYNVLQSVLTASQLRRARRALHDRWLQDPHRGGRFGQERQYELLQLDPVFAELLEAIPEKVNAMIASMLGPWIIGAVYVDKSHPVKWAVPEELRTREKALSLHSGFPYGSHPIATGLQAVPASYPWTVQLLFMVDDFTEDNGGIVVQPGSHRERRLPQGLPDRLRILNQTRTVTGKAGDLIVSIGQAWHGSDLNMADRPRVGVTVLCLPWYFKPLQSFSYTLPYSVERRLSKRLRVRLGLKHSHFLMHTVTLGYDSLQHQLYHKASFLWDMLYHGYSTRHGRSLFRRPVLVALSAAAIVPVGCAKARPRVSAEALRMVAAGLTGVFFGMAMTMERLGM